MNRVEKPHILDRKQEDRIRDPTLDEEVYIYTKSKSKLDRTPMFHMDREFQIGNHLKHISGNEPVAFLLGGLY